MRFRVNWGRFALYFLSFQALFLLVGCTAAWLSTVSALLPALETAVTAIVSFVLALQGKTTTADFAAKVQAIGNAIASEIANVQQLIAEFKANASTGLLSQIQAVFQGIVASLSSILQDANITDASTIAKITNLVGLAVAAAQAVIALIPVAVAKLSNPATTKAELETEDTVVSGQLKNAHKLLQETYHVVVTAQTENVDVNSALATLPQELP